MDKSKPAEVWAAGDRYEPYVGRWSRLVAAEFLTWLGAAEGKRWADIGCGTGALTQTILSTQRPVSVVGVDRSEGFIQHTKQHTGSTIARFVVADAQALPLQSERFDAVVSALVLNFVPSHERMVAEMARLATAGGICGLYVWDYADKMELLRYFWDAAARLEHEGAALDEATRFPICQPGPLRELFEKSGLNSVEVRPIDVPTVFADFDDYWTPFLGGQGSAPTYTMSLPEEKRAELREAIRESLPFESDGSIRLIARAWAVKGTRS